MLIRFPVLNGLSLHIIPRGLTKGFGVVSEPIFLDPFALAPPEHTLIENVIFVLRSRQPYRKAHPGVGRLKPGAGLVEINDAPIEIGDRNPILVH